MRTWILDFIKSNVLSTALGLPLIAALLKIIQWAGPAFVSYAMAMVIGLQLVLIPAYPVRPEHQTVLHMQLFNPD